MLTFYTLEPKLGNICLFGTCYAVIGNQLDLCARSLLDKAGEKAKKEWGIKVMASLALGWFASLSLSDPCLCASHLAYLCVRVCVRLCVCRG